MSMMSTRIQEVFSLAAWYNDVLKRYEQLAAWTAGNLVTPNSVWLSGLFNPKAFLTAVSSSDGAAHPIHDDSADHSAYFVCSGQLAAAEPCCSMPLMTWLAYACFRSALLCCR